MSFNVIGLANAVIDMSFRPVRFPILPAEHQFVQQRLITPGGMANTLICGARLGLSMQGIGYIGNDELADLWRNYLVAEGVGVAGQIVVADQPTPVAMCLTDETGHTCFWGHGGICGYKTAVFPHNGATSSKQPTG